MGLIEFGELGIELDDILRGWVCIVRAEMTLQRAMNFGGAFEG